MHRRRGCKQKNETKDLTQTAQRQREYSEEEADAPDDTLGKVPGFSSLRGPEGGFGAEKAALSRRAPKSRNEVGGFFVRCAAGGQPSCWTVSPASLREETTR